MPPASATASACIAPSNPAPPVIITTRPSSRNRPLGPLIASPATRLSSVHNQTRTRNERRPRRREKHHGVCDLLGNAHALHRHVRRNISLHLLGRFFELALPYPAGEQDIAGSHRVHANVVNSKLPRQDLAQRDEARFRTGIGQRCRKRFYSRQR